MKKLMVFSLLLALVSGAAFAELLDGLAIYAWGKADFVPIKLVGETRVDGVRDGFGSFAAAGVGIAWGGMRPDFNLAVKGEYSHVGFNIGLKFSADEKNDNDFITGDASMWLKPFGNNWFKLTIGKFEDTSLAGKIGAVNYGFEYFSLYGGVKEEDQIFSRFSTYDARRKNHVSGINFDNVGFMLSSQPIKGLDLGMMVDGSFYGKDWGGIKWGAGAAAADVYRFMQFAAGYAFSKGHVRAQYIGGHMGSIDTPVSADINSEILKRPSRFEAAFAFSGIQKLFLELGTKVWMPIQFTDMKYCNGIDASLAARFRYNAFDLRTRVDVMGINAYTKDVEYGMYDGGRDIRFDSKANDGVRIDFRMAPNYDFDKFSIGLDFGMRITTQSKDDLGFGNKNGLLELGFGVLASKRFGGGLLRGGLSYTVMGGEKAGINLYTGKASGSPVFQIPILMEFSFM